ncbi:MAG: TusE/DsrC/DsvC family sulfur relay protein, partial [Proteobacteria bacterium]|nr:TusE/DsrC/DsvC family sulfur relay protein [Candidatus Avisuccinivibrio stercorigallinarum]
MSIVLNGREILTDAEGYLMDWREWSPEVMEKIAEKMGLALTEQHLTVINTVRDYFKEYADTPPMRGLI